MATNANSRAKADSPKGSSARAAGYVAVYEEGNMDDAADVIRAFATVKDAKAAVPDGFYTLRQWIDEEKAWYYENPDRLRWAQVSYVEIETDT